MKFVKLGVKPAIINRIVEGKPTTLKREIRPQNERKFIQLDDDGCAMCNEAGNSIPVHYDAVQVVCANRSILVSIKEAYTELLVDDEGNVLFYEIDGEPYYMENIVYELGNILSGV